MEDFEAFAFNHVKRCSNSSCFGDIFRTTLLLDGLCVNWEPHYVSRTFVTFVKISESLMHISGS